MYTLILARVQGQPGIYETILINHIYIYIYMKAHVAEPTVGNTVQPAVLFKEVTVKVEDLAQW